MQMWPRIAMIAVLLCPLVAPAGTRNYGPPSFIAGREYHTGHSARPHRVKKHRRSTGQRRAPQPKKSQTQ
jgi:hypothetical protein